MFSLRLQQLPVIILEKLYFTNLNSVWIAGPLLPQCLALRCSTHAFMEDTDLILFRQAGLNLGWSCFSGRRANAGAEDETKKPCLVLLRNFLRENRAAVVTATGSKQPEKCLFICSSSLSSPFSMSSGHNLL